MGLLHKIAADAIELSRALRKERPEVGTRPSAREVCRTVLSQDGYKVLLLSRIRESARRRHIPGVNHVLRLATTVLFSIEIGNEIELGEGIDFVHTLGTVIGGTSKIGARVRFLGNNTVGTAKDNGCPVIEDDVVVGCGARILGPIRIGRGAVIGANAVVLIDVPPGAIAFGIPAKVQVRAGRDALPSAQKASHSPAQPTGGATSRPQALRLARGGSPPVVAASGSDAL